ncbi:N-acetylglucosamine-6-phosphate deacetylase [Catenovulum sediminis]|uniref:N-acetylgalactosamine-6-phosphate deacetylase n=1 Tax=Catenovulum sediminis TaxID=1740262 RepID=A0ABV1RDR9_9ALTE
MTIQRYRPDQLFTGDHLMEKPVVSVENGTVISIEADSNLPALPLEGLLAPGYIDIQVNGGGGVLFNNQPSVESLRKMIIAHSQYGSTALLPTLITDDLATMQAAADAVAHARERKLAGILGIHFEGPHLSVEKKGVHPKQQIRPITDAEFAIFARQDIGIKVITLAPENVSVDDIRKLIQLNVIVCLGHSNASYEVVEAALDAGATGFTHLFNAMSPLTSRAPGMVGAALNSEKAWCGIIVDHHHMHPAVAQLACRVKGADKSILVTDAMALIGSKAQSFDLFGETVTLKGDKLTISTGQLAGSHLSMQKAVQNTVHDLKISLTDALKMASLSAARFLNCADQIGKIKAGYSADWILLDKALRVTSVWIKGTQREQLFQLDNFGGSTCN